VECKNPDLLNHPNFEKYWMAYHYTGVDLEEDNSYEKPLYTKFCYRLYFVKGPFLNFPGAFQLAMTVFYRISV
jgi:hypothetical protein